MARAPKQPPKPANQSSRRASAPKRASWKGSLRLDLVDVPVSVFPASTTGNQIAFHQIHGPSGKQIKYEKVVTGVGTVAPNDIVKGYEVTKGKYILFTDEEIDAIRLENQKVINLVQFVDACEIEPLWYDRPYYVVPENEEAEQAYDVVRDALRKAGKVGLGQFAIRGHDYIAAIKPCGRGLILETLRFKDEIAESSKIFAGIPKVKSDPDLLDLAKTLIDKKAKPFNIDDFEDRYTVALRAAVEAKARTGKPIVVDADDGSRSNVINLADALKRSVSGAEPPKPKSRAR